MKNSIRLLTTLVCFALGAASGQAASSYWDSDGPTSGGSSGTTADGIWGTSTFWSTASAGNVATAAWTSGDDAVFSAGTDVTGASSIGIAAGGVTCGNLTVEEGTITITSGGGTLNIGGSVASKGVVSIGSGLTTTIDAAVAGGDSAGVVTKQGAGTLVLSGANTYGTTYVYGGTLSFNSIGDWAASPSASALGAPTTSALGLIRITTSTTAATLRYTGGGHTSNRGFNMSGTSATATIDASGSGALVLNDNNLVATHTAGKLLVLTGTSASTVLNTIGGVIPFPVSGLPTGVGPRLDVDKTGTGTWVLSGANTYNGYSSVKQGTLVINTIRSKTANSASSLGKQSATTYATIGIGFLGPATLKFVGTSLGTTDRTISFAGGAGNHVTLDGSTAGTTPFIINGTVTAAAGSKTVYLKGSFAATTGGAANSIIGIPDPADTPTSSISVVKQDAGSWQINNGGSAYTGPTDIQEGRLFINHNSALGTTAGGTTVQSGAQLSFTGAAALTGVTEPVTLNGTGVSNDGALRLAGVTAGAITWLGTITLGSAARINADSTLANILSGGVNGAGKALTIGGTGSLTISGTGISGTGTTLTKDGSGTLLLGVANTYDGGTTLSGGTLEIGASGSIKGNVTITGSVLKLDNASALESTATLTLPASPTAGTVDLNFSGTQTISALYFGVVQQDQGTWGAVGNAGAAHQSAAFSGSGILLVNTGNHTPVAPAAKSLTTVKNTIAKYANPKLLAGATDADPLDTLSVTAAGPSSAQGGTAAWSASEVTYTPPTDYTGPDSFTYTISDGHSTVLGTVNVTVDSGTGLSPNVVAGPTYANGKFSVTFAGIPGFTYTVEYTTASPPTTSWTKLVNLSASASTGLFTVEDTVSQDPQRYYRTVYPAY